MKHDPTLAETGLRQLCDTLGLAYEAQDWGIVNADASRLEEFILYYERHPELDSTQRFELAELILASANELLLEGQASIPMKLRSFLAQHGRDFVPHLEYWRELDDQEEFPLTNWLDEHCALDNLP